MEGYLISLIFKGMQNKMTVRCYLMPVRMATIKKQGIISSEDVEKTDPWTLLVEVYIGAATMENCVEVPLKIKNRTIIGFSISTSG